MSLQGLCTSRQGPLKEKSRNQSARVSVSLTSPTWVTFGSPVGSRWGHLKSLGSHWDLLGAVVASPWGYFGVTFGQPLADLGITCGWVIVGSLWENVCFTFGSRGSLPCLSNSRSTASAAAMLFVSAEGFQHVASTVCNSSLLATTPPKIEHASGSRWCVMRGGKSISRCMVPSPTSNFKSSCF